MNIDAIPSDEKREASASSFKHETAMKTAQRRPLHNDTPANANTEDLIVSDDGGKPMKRRVKYGAPLGRRPVLPPLDISEQPTSFAEFNPRRLYIDNVPFSATKGDILEFMDGYKIERVDFPKKPGTNKSWGKVYVNVATEAEARLAIRELSGREIGGRRVQVQAAKVSNSYKKRHSKVSPVGQSLRHSISIESEEAHRLDDHYRKMALAEESIAYNPMKSSMDKKLGVLEHFLSFQPAILANDESFIVACKSIMSGQKTLEELFCDLTLTDEQKKELRRFTRILPPLALTPTKADRAEWNGESQQIKAQIETYKCDPHGIHNCAECNQRALMKQLYNEEHSLTSSSDESLGPSPRLTNSQISKKTNEGFSIVKAGSPPNHHRSTSSTTTIDYPSYRDVISKGDVGIIDYSKPPLPPQHSAHHSLGGETAYTILSRPMQNSVVSTQEGRKTHCTFFLRTGHCDFVQQGCKYSHELPPGGIAELLAQTGKSPVDVSRNTYGPRRNGLVNGVYGGEKNLADTSGIIGEGGHSRISSRPALERCDSSFSLSSQFFPKSLAAEVAGGTTGFGLSRSHSAKQPAAVRRSIGSFASGRIENQYPQHQHSKSAINSWRDASEQDFEAAIRATGGGRLTDGANGFGMHDKYNLSYYTRDINSADGNDDEDLISLSSYR